MHTEIPEELSPYDRLAALFTKPCTFVSFTSLCQASEGGKNTLSDQLYKLRRQTGKDIESVYHAGGWCWVPENAGTHFDLINFRDPPIELVNLSDEQQEAFEQIWRHVRKVERIEYQWRGQMIHVLNPFISGREYEILSTMISTLATEKRGLEWEDVYPTSICHQQGRDNLSSIASGLNRFLKSQSVPYRFASKYGTAQYRLVGQ